MASQKILWTTGVTTGLVGLIVTFATADAATSVGVAGAAAAPADPAKVLGNESCVKCHAAEMDVWRRTPHAETFQTLHRRPEAQKIAAKLGVQSIKYDGRCVDCHYTTQVDTSRINTTGQVHAISGVSCESCHGPARDWIDLHADFGGPTMTAATESAEHRRYRIESSIAAGMRNPTNVYLVAQSCLRCHTTADESLVNIGGHTAGSTDFEFVSWSQGTIRHNFVRGGGSHNTAAGPSQRRVMFVAGMMAELEASLRATAIATTKDTFGITSAQRSARTIKRLRSVAAKIDSPHVDRVLAVAADVSLKLNHRQPLEDAADRIAAIGYEMASVESGDNWQVLDDYIPTQTK